MDKRPVGREVRTLLSTTPRYALTSFIILSFPIHDPPAEPCPWSIGTIGLKRLGGLAIHPLHPSASNILICKAR